ncbi:Cell division protein FtsH [Minicystis rosea]|nr:Cell division protein FtsH [Minicystis rosea]
MIPACFLVGATASMFACSATGKNEFNSGTNGTGGHNGTGGGDFNFTTGSGSTGSGDGILTSTPPCNFNDPNADHDGDGFTPAQGDCNDCTAQMNPGAFDFPGNNVDEDCNGKADDTPTNCDGNLAVDSSNAVDGAKAIGLCKMAEGASWGLVSARYATADNQPLANFDPQGLGHGILSGFGPNVHPQEGVKVLALSSGTARQPTDVGYQSVSGYDKGYGPEQGAFAPPGFPKESPSCPGVVTGEPHDSAALEVTVKVPSNAKSLAFNLDFYTYEYPDYICDQYNDFFVALLNPPPADLADGNISFDSQGNLVSVNAGFLQVCHPTQAGGKNFTCPLGAGQLQGTGFDQDLFGDTTDNSAATGWLQTTAPVEPGSTIKLRFATWDSGDGVLDSTVLLDNFTWDAKGGDTVTAPVGVPK